MNVRNERDRGILKDRVERRLEQLRNEQPTVNGHWWYLQDGMALVSLLSEYESLRSSYMEALWREARA